jgi:hypothetical protein
MATLTEVSSMARKGIKYGVVGLVIMAMIPGTISLIKKIYLTLNPPPPPPPTVRYGKLPKLDFPEAVGFATPEYKLETISGGLPSLPSVGKVFAVGINKSRLLTLDRMKQKAKTVGFDNDPIELDERTYRFLHPSAPIDLIFDVISGSLAYKYDWTRDKKTGSVFDVPIGDAAATEAKRFLERLGTLPEDLNSGASTVRYLAATESAMVPSPSAYEANFVRVDIFRADKDGLKIMTVGGDTSPVNVILSGQTAEKRVIQANYYYSQVLDDDFATYPLKPINASWEELIKGQGFIAKRTTEKSVTIRRVYMAFYESNNRQEFLQPIYVFEGDLDFRAYVSAISPSYVIQ